MKKFCKIIAVIMAVLMLVTMATACKNSSDDEFDGVFNPGGDTVQDGNNQTNQGGEDNTDDPSGSTPGDDNTPDGSSQGDKKPSGGTQGDKNPTNGDDKKPGNDGEPTKKPVDQEQANKEYVASEKYNMDNNPLLFEGKKENTKFELNFDLDTTGFVKNNIKIADLKGKTLNLITGVRYGCWEFKNDKGEYVSEFDWFDECKKLFGLNVKYTISRFDQADQQALTYMNAGKALDIIGTHVGGFPKYLNLSRPLDPYINIQNKGNSPGVCEMTLEQTKWGGSYRCMSAIGAVNVMWYNQSLVEQFNLKDPHKLFQEDKWDWDAFEAFMKSIPKTTPEGKELKAYRQCGSDMKYSWPLTNGCGDIEIDTKSKEPNLINNWLDDRTVAAREFISRVCKSVNYGGSFGNLYTDGTLMMSDAYNMNPNFDSTDYGKAHKYNWVPFPKANTPTGRYVAFNYGFTQMLAKKMKTESNAPYAVKFMELWANRFTEANYDFFSQNTSIAMDYKAKKEHFEFCINNTYFGVQMNEWDMVTGDNKKAFSQFSSSYTNPQYNVTTEGKAVANIVEQAIKDCLIYGT
ncbi:MAG: hypothetical protein IKM48_03730 [Clostridia bacterium]|nr:hypothetical protein [Clostridia bacterium]